KPKREKDAAYHKEKMLLCKQEEVGIQLNEEQVNWRDGIDDESEDQELEAHYMYMAQIQEVSPDAANFGPIFDSGHCKRKQLDQDDDDDDLANERELLASLIEKLKCEIEDSKNRNKFLETSKKVLVEKLKGEIEDFKTQNKSLESSNNHFKEANNKQSETNELMYKDLKKVQAKLDRRNDVKYASKINDLNQMISEMKKELSAHQETISILSQAKEAQIKLYKTREDKELDKVISLEKKVNVLDNIVYKTGQSVQTMNMLNSKCKMSFAKPVYLKKAQRANPHLYDIEEMVADLRYFNSLELKLDSLKSQLETQKTHFLKEIDRFSREYYYADHMNAILGVYTELDEVTNLQCNYLEMLEKCECVEKELLKSKMMSKSFEALQKHAINVEIDLQQCQEKIKMTNLSKKISQKNFAKNVNKTLKFKT
nr:hypothetical protein [Tanacetum cinerariifolium]